MLPGVDSCAVPVVQGVKLLSDGGDLFDSVLMSGQVGLEGLVLLLHGLQLEDLAVLVVLQQTIKLYFFQEIFTIFCTFVR